MRRKILTTKTGKQIINNNNSIRTSFLSLSCSFSILAHTRKQRAALVLKRNHAHLGNEHGEGQMAPPGWTDRQTSRHAEPWVTAGC